MEVGTHVGPQRELVEVLLGHIRGATKSAFIAGIIAIAAKGRNGQRVPPR
jgi:hypothetical protein